MNSDAAVLAGRNLELWRGDKRLFRDLSFAAGTGELVHVTGPNGAGKTSLLRVICGLTLPDEGTVSWRGHAVTRRRIEYHDELTYVGHRDALKGDLTAAENLRSAVALHDAAAGKRVGAVLNEVGLDTLADLPARYLSAGQKRRLSIVRAMLMPATVWIMDEPFANLDADGRDWAAALVTAHLDEGGIAVVTSHYELEVSAARRHELVLGG